MTKRCHEAQAVTAFLWFALIAYIVSLITDLIGGGRGMGGMRRSKSRSRLRSDYAQVLQFADRDLSLCF